MPNPEAFSDCSDAGGSAGADPGPCRARLLELWPEARERPVQRYLDRVRLHSQDLPDLPRGEVGAVPQGDEIL